MGQNISSDPLKDFRAYSIHDCFCRRGRCTLVGRSGSSVFNHGGSRDASEIVTASQKDQVRSGTNF